MTASTIDSIHTILHQVLDMAVDDDYIRTNPSNHTLKEWKKAEFDGLDRYFTASKLEGASNAESLPNLTQSLTR